jgi:hypothetical protein
MAGKRKRGKKPTGQGIHTSPKVAQRVASGVSQRAPGYAATQSSPRTPDLQWPASIMPTDKPYPAMPAVRDDKPPLTQMGATGTAIFSGVITSEEYNPDFFWKDGIAIYEQMRRNDAQVNAVLLMAELPIRRAEWKIEPASEDPRDVEIAAFVESCLFHDMCYETAQGQQRYQSWDWTVQHILMMLQYGFSTFEVCYKIEDGWVKWARWIPLLPRTVWRWWVGDDNELVGIQQWTFKDYTYQFVNIPAEKLLHFAYRQEGNNYEGVSLLRSAYKHWFYKQNFEKIEAIGVERNAVVPPVVRLPENWTAADVQAAQAIGQNMRANEQMAVTLPYGWDLEFPKNQQKFAANAQEAIQYHDVMIARNFLCQFLNLGSTETGAYNLNASQQNTFFNALQAICVYIEDIINHNAIRRLVDYNFDDVAVYPQLKCSKIAAQDIATISNSLKDLTASRSAPVIHPNPELEDFVCDLLGIPKPPANQVEATNPTSPTDPNRPQNARADDHQTQQPTDQQGAPTTGASMRELTGEIVALREAVVAIDAVGRGLNAPERSMVLFNPAHEPAGAPNGGEFAPKGAGGGGGGGGKAKGTGRSKGASTGRKGKAAKSEDADVSKGETISRAEHQKAIDDLKSQHAADLAKRDAAIEELRQQVAALKGGKGEKAAGRGQEKDPYLVRDANGRLKQTTGVTPLYKIEDYHPDPYKMASQPSLRAMHRLYGTDQLGRALGNKTMSTLRGMAARWGAAHPEYGRSSGSTKAGVIDYLVRVARRHDGDINNAEDAAAAQKRDPLTGENDTL